MNIAHVTWLLSRAGGGIPEVVFPLANALGARGCSVFIAGVDDGDPLERATTVDVVKCRPMGPRALGVCPGIDVALSSRQPDLVHQHGLFTWQSVQVRRYGRTAGRPVVISPHGMLEPWALARSVWKKRLFRLFVEDENLNHAAALHALNRPEANNLRALGLRNPIAIVPNGVDVPDPTASPDRQTSRERLLGSSAGRILLFMGRIHPKKGLHHLVDAWASLSAESIVSGGKWTLVIAGPDQLGHEAEVTRQVAERGMEGSVRFVGPLYGAAKVQALAAADVFVLPSFSEGFSMAVLEAMSWRVPVVITRACNFDVATPGAGLLCDPAPASIAAALRDILTRTDEERACIGEAGRSLVERTYTWGAVAANLHAVYAWSLGGGSPPACVEVLC